MKTILLTLLAGVLAGCIFRPWEPYSEAVYVWGNRDEHIALFVNRGEYQQGNVLALNNYRDTRVSLYAIDPRHPEERKHLFTTDGNALVSNFLFVESEGYILLPLLTPDLSEGETLYLVDTAGAATRIQFPTKIDVNDGGFSLLPSPDGATLALVNRYSFSCQEPVAENPRCTTRVAFYFSTSATPSQWSERRELVIPGGEPEVRWLETGELLLRDQFETTFRLDRTGAHPADSLELPCADMAVPGESQFTADFQSVAVSEAGEVLGIRDSAETVAYYRDKYGYDPTTAGCEIQ